MQKEVWKIDANRLMYKQRVCLDNKTKAHKNKKRHRNKYKCRSKLNPRNWGFFICILHSYLLEKRLCFLMILFGPQVYQYDHIAP